MIPNLSMWLVEDRALRETITPILTVLLLSNLLNRRPYLLGVSLEIFSKINLLVQITLFFDKIFCS